jgi:CRP-like cAMP-binding protein
MHSPRLNFLLDSLPEPDYERLAPHLELVGLSAGTEIFHTGKKRTGIYFPSTCTVSAQVELEQGVCTDIYLLGNQGLFGTGTPQRGTYFKAIVRKPGFAYRCPPEIFTEELLRGEGVMLMSMVAARIIMEEMAKNITCRTFHSVSQQVARWLIRYGQADAVETISVTHHDLAMALGIRRERVTLALREIKGQGGISLNRGHIQVKDYDLLSKHACACDNDPTFNKVWTEHDLIKIHDLPSKLKKFASLARTGVTA